MDIFLGLVFFVIILFIVIGLIANFWEVILLLVLLIGLLIGSLMALFIYLDKKEQTKKQAKVKKHAETIEGKMERLLQIAHLEDPEGKYARLYIQKSTYNVRDYWYKYLDVRAKMLLNNVSVHEEEEVLHLMCDEIFTRLEQAEITGQAEVKREFIEENLNPLLRDIIGILQGERQYEPIRINAYKLLRVDEKNESHF